MRQMSQQPPAPQQQQPFQPPAAMHQQQQQFQPAQQQQQHGMQNRNSLGMPGFSGPSGMRQQPGQQIPPPQYGQGMYGGRQGVPPMSSQQQIRPPGMPSGKMNGHGLSGRNVGNVPFNGASSKPPPGIDPLSRARSAPASGRFNPPPAMPSQQPFQNRADSAGGNYSSSSQQGSMGSSMYNQSNAPLMGQPYGSIGGGMPSQGNRLVGQRNSSDPNPRSFGVGDSRGVVEPPASSSWDRGRGVGTVNSSAPSWNHQQPGQKPPSLGQGWNSASSFNPGSGMDTSSDPSAGGAFGSGIFSMASTSSSSGWGQQQLPQDQQGQGQGQNNVLLQGGTNWQLGGSGSGNSGW